MSKNSCVLTAWGAIGNATGSNFLLKTASLNILIDCGLVQGSKFAGEENREDFPYDPRGINFLFVTHAHMDHIGRIPKLAQNGFKGTIYSTKETKELAVLMFEDALALLEREAKESDVEPLYTKEDVDSAMALWKTVEYHSAMDISPDVSVYMKDAGHVLGSAIIEFTVKSADRKIAFTGDLGNSPTPLLKDTEYVSDADYMVIESVYGDRNHEPKNLRDAKLKKVLYETLSKGGTVVIPAFSLERTQVILYEINELVEAQAIPRVPVFLDSPLAIRVTEVYKRFNKNFNAERVREIAMGDDIFDFPGLRIVGSHAESESIHKMEGAKIIIAGSGMSMGGRVLHHEKYYLSDPKSTILLVGYQVPGSAGRQIEERVKTIVLDGEYIKVKARVEKISGYSSHKDSDHLVEFVSHTLPKIKKIFVAMGEMKSSAFLAERLRDELELDALVPEKGKVYDLA